MESLVQEALRGSAVFRRLDEADLQRLAAVARVERFARGETVFSEGEPSEFFYTVVTGRIKIAKKTRAGKDVILEIFGPGDPFGAVAAYEGVPFPASALTLEDGECLVIPRAAFFALLEQRPSLARGLLLGLTQRLVELTRRRAELTGGHVEGRFARLFLKLGRELGQKSAEGTYVPLHLSRQELADMTGTTVETCIRIMSRWAKDGIVLTQKNGFILADLSSLEALAAE